MSVADDSGGVRIGNVSGGIHGSVIAGRDVLNAVITIGDRTVAADKTPDLGELSQLLADIQKELRDLAQDATVKQSSPAAPFLAQGAAQTVTEAAAKVSADMPPGAGASVQKGLTDATSLVQTILESAQSVGASVEKAMPILEKIGVAALWAAKLWM